LGELEFVIYIYCYFMFFVENNDECCCSFLSECTVWQLCVS